MPELVADGVELAVDAPKSRVVFVAPEPVVGVARLNGAPLPSVVLVAPEPVDVAVEGTAVAATSSVTGRERVMAAKE